MNRVPLVLGACALAVIVVAAAAAVLPDVPAALPPTGQGFLLVPGIPGESLDARHAGETDVLGVQFGETREFSLTGSGVSSRVQFASILVETPFDSSTPQLITRGASGEILPFVTLTLRHADGFEYLRINMTSTVISSVNVSGVDPGTPSAPLVTLGLGFQRITFDYTVENSDGTAGPTIHGGWDVALDRAA